MAEPQIGHRKSCLVLSARFPVAKWRSYPVAKSAYWWERDRVSRRTNTGRSACPCSSIGIAFSLELAPLSLVCCTAWSRSGDNDSSILSIRDFAAALLLALISHFLSSISSRAGMMELWVTIELTCGAVISSEALNCSKLSRLRSGIPIPPCAGDRLTSSLSSSGRGSARPNNEW